MLGQGSVEGDICFDQCPIYGMFSPIAGIRGPGDQQVEIGIMTSYRNKDCYLTVTPVTLTSTSSDPLGKCLLPVLKI